jgi:hypothetical protein
MNDTNNEQVGTIKINAMNKLTKFVFSISTKFNKYTF